MIAPEVFAFAQEPVFIALAVADAALRPTIVRAAVITFEGTRARVIVGDSLGGGSEALVAALDGKLVAVVISSPVRAQSYQLKGRIAAARIATQAELAEGMRRLGLLGEMVEQMQGLSASLYRDLRIEAGAAVDIEVTDCFHQSPGAQAGARIG